MWIIEMLSLTKPKWFEYWTWVVGFKKGNIRMNCTRVKNR